MSGGKVYLGSATAYAFPVSVMSCRKQKQKEKKTFANMFDKFARIDAKKEEEARKNQPPLQINEWENKKNAANSSSSGDGSDVLKVSGDVQMDIDLDKEMSNAEQEQS